MPDDAGLRIFLTQVLEEFKHRFLLSLSTSVDSTAFGIIASLVAYTDGTVVVVPGMGSTDVLGKGGDNLTVHTDVIVVAGLAEACIACGDEAFHTEGTCDLRGAAVDDNQLHVLALEGLHRHDWTKKVDTMAVMTVRTKFAILFKVCLFIIKEKFLRNILE